MRTMATIPWNFAPFIRPLKLQLATKLLTNSPFKVSISSLWSFFAILACPFSPHPPSPTQTMLCRNCSDLEKHLTRNIEWESRVFTAIFKRSKEWCYLVMHHYLVYQAKTMCQLSMSPIHGCCVYLSLFNILHSECYWCKFHFFTTMFAFRMFIKEQLSRSVVRFITLSHSI